MCRTVDAVLETTGPPGAGPFGRRTVMCSDRGTDRSGESESSDGVVPFDRPEWVDAVEPGTTTARAVPGLEPGAPKRNVLVALCYVLCTLITVDLLSLF